MHTLLNVLAVWFGISLVALLVSPRLRMMLLTRRESALQRLLRIRDLLVAEMVTLETQRVQCKQALADTGCWANFNVEALPEHLRASTLDRIRYAARELRIAQSRMAATQRNVNVLQVKYDLAHEEVRAERRAFTAQSDALRAALCAAA